MNPMDPSTSVAVMPDLWITMLKSGIMLCIVLAVLFLVLYWMKKILSGQSSFRGQGMIRQIASLHLAPKEKVVLLEVLGRKILIGITSNSINCLSTIETEEDFSLSEPKESRSFFQKLVKASAENNVKPMKPQPQKTGSMENGIS
ncbi:MAG: flagellar biosynthetic protein FliO [Pseudomonadota bacterium]